MSSNKPNIVYIGDEVRHTRYGDHTPEWVVCGAAGPLASLCTDKTDWAHAKEFYTPDGRPVDGFGGAKIDVPDPQFTDGFAGRVGGWIVTEGHVNQESAVDFAIQAAVQFYGEWVREATEADLKRRGLL